MAKISHNKLIRDRIPAIIEQNGKKCKVRVLDNQEYLTELKNKLLEESLEVQQSVGREDIIKEIADVLEVLEAIKIALKITKEEVETVQLEKAISNGRFEQKLFLEYVMENE